MCYHFIEEQLTWVDAREECRLRGGYREHGDLVLILIFYPTVQKARSYYDWNDYKSNLA